MSRSKGNFLFSADVFHVYGFKSREEYNKKKARFGITPKRAFSSIEWGQYHEKAACEVFCALRICAAVGAPHGARGLCVPGNYFSSITLMYAGRMILSMQISSSIR